MQFCSNGWRPKLIIGGRLDMLSLEADITDEPDENNLPDADTLMNATEGLKDEQTSVLHEVSV